MTAIEDIHAGKHDDVLDDLLETIHDRRRVLARRATASFEKGDAVKITGARPRYLNGATATVVEARVSKVVVQFPDNMGRHDQYGRFAGKRIVIPALMLVRT